MMEAGRLILKGEHGMGLALQRKTLAVTEGVGL